MQYMLLIYGPGQQRPETGGPPMPDMNPWIEYTQWLQESGILRAGDPLAPASAATTVRVQNGQRVVTDGPFAETKEVLGGYYLIDCPDLDKALEAAARCPGARFGSVEVRPIAAMPSEVTDAVSAGARR